MLKAALVNRRVELGREPTEDDALKVAASLAKQRRDSISQFERAGRTDLVAQEKAELALLETFLPPPVDEAEVERIVNAAIAETNANTPRDIGRVMKQVMTQVGGQSVDGSAVSALVKRKLSRER
jgi:uncharacterized protein YqeY|tara:strand:- start:3253 stop:3627 length:375 start_codon:yes stop_codon:yes gene_type:complete